MMQRAELRCSSCNRCLAKVLRGTGSISIDLKCRCGKMTIIHITFTKKDVQNEKEPL